ncbi:hypothetical protein BX600DRAFT_440686 [Xylariales sp. PMI_506]|nr:hypothetical protein BX600DRAFT_440686 [Xylariales sp. PMI_506]
MSLVHIPTAVDSQSKPGYNSEDEKEETEKPPIEPDQSNKNQSDGSNENPVQSDGSNENPVQSDVFKGWNSEIINAVQSAIDSHVSFLRSRYEDKGLFTKNHVDVFESNPVSRNEVKETVVQKLTEIRKEHHGKDPSEEEIKDIDSHLDVIIKMITAETMKLATKDGHNKERKFSPLQMKLAMRRVWDLNERNATYYEMLGVPTNATKEQIRKAQIQKLAPLHSDKNNFDDAPECYQLIKGAGDALLHTLTRLAYDESIKMRPKVEHNGENFAASAFDGIENQSKDDVIESTAEDIELTDSEFEHWSESDDEEPECPPPTDFIMNIHALMGKKVIKKFFKDLDCKIKTDQLTRVMSVHNGRIKADNLKYKLERPNPLIYTVPVDKLLTCRYVQRRIIQSFVNKLVKPEGTQKELQNLHKYFEKERKRGLYQWPGEWTELLMEPLKERLMELGLPKDKTEIHSTDPDTHMDDAGHLLMNSQREVRNLAYSASLRDGGTRWYSGFKLFVEVQGPNRLGVKEIHQVSDEVISQCRGSKDLHNIKTQERIFPTLKKQAFAEVKGVAWLADTGSKDRTCWTYVWVKMRGNPLHEAIMTRSTLRSWLTQKVADKVIDNFVVAQRIIPPWSPQVRNNPSHPDSYQLVHALPGKSDKQLRWRGHRHVYDNYGDDDDYNDGSSDFSHSLRDRSDTKTDALAGLMNNLAITMQSIQKLVEGQQVVMNRLLTGPE